jgi:hypothetical protein
MGNQNSHYLYIVSFNSYKVIENSIDEILSRLEKSEYCSRIIDNKVVFYNKNMKRNNQKNITNNNKNDQYGFIPEMIKLYGLPLYVFSKQDYDRFLKN